VNAVAYDANVTSPTPALMSRIFRALERRYGPRQLRTWGKAVPVLVETILSQNTSNANSEAGFRILRRTFRTWDDVADAPVQAVERAIRISGLSNTKAPRIQSILRQIRQRHGRISLEFLKRLPPAEALQYLRGFHGVGPKTANCTLLFAFGMPLFPVDTHIHRIAIRMGWIGVNATLEQAHEVLADAIKPAERYSLHVLLIEHGRKVCKPGRPRCEQCVVLRWCAYGTTKRGANALGAKVNRTRLT
jgi:endonuclease-3